MKKTLLTLLTFGTLGCASLHPRMEGTVDLAYVPYRIDDVERNNEMKAGTNLEAIIPTRTGDFVFGGGGTAFGLIDNPYRGFNPTRLESNVYLGLRTRNFFFYVHHGSNHPVGYQGTYMQINQNDRININNESYFRDIGKYRLNESDAITELGVRFKIGLLR